MESEKEMFYRCFNNTLKDVLDKEDLTYKEVAPVLDMSLGTFTNKINRTCGRFTLYEVTKLAEFLNVKVSDLIRGAYAKCNSYANY